MTPLRIVVAPSGFKESLSAEQVAQAIAAGIQRAAPNAMITQLPLVDGGEGFAQTLTRVTGGEIYPVQVTGPVGEPIESHFGILGNNAGASPRTAVLEMAAAAGLHLVPRDRRDPLQTTTYGVGELIHAALDADVERIIVGCGDSGTNDGGAGAAQALGVRLLKADGKPIGCGGAALAELAHIDLSQRDERLARVQIDVACNMQNLLCGENSVARIFGAQKGASPETVAQMERALERFADVIQRDLNTDVASIPGGGASGGLGAGLYALLGAELHSRYEIVTQYLKIDEALQSADFVFTAEGSIDFQTPLDKIPVEVALRAKRLGIPVFVLAGSIGRGAEINYQYGIDAMFSILTRPCTLEEAISETHESLAACAENVMRAVIQSTKIPRHS